LELTQRPLSVLHVAEFGPKLGENLALATFSAGVLCVCFENDDSLEGAWPRKVARCSQFKRERRERRVHTPNILNLISLSCSRTKLLARLIDPES